MRIYMYAEHVRVKMLLI